MITLILFFRAVICMKILLPIHTQSSLFHGCCGESWKDSCELSAPGSKSMQSALQYFHHHFEEGPNLSGWLCIQNHFKDAISDTQGCLWLCSNSLPCKLNSEAAEEAAPQFIPVECAAAQTLSSGWADNRRILALWGSRQGSNSTTYCVTCAQRLADPTGKTLQEWLGKNPIYPLF